MSISEQIEIMIQTLTNNNHPPQIITITRTYPKNIVDIQLPDGTIQKEVKSSGRGVTGGKGLLCYNQGSQTQPYIILFEDADQTITSLGLGRFYIHDDELYVELPNNTSNPFTLVDGDLTVTSDETVNNYELKDNDIYYERWDFQ